MEELDHTPDTSFERDVVCEDEESFCLSTDNIAALQSLLQQVRGLTREGVSRGMQGATAWLSAIPCVRAPFGELLPGGLGRGSASRGVREERVSSG